jgi:hypothetical protein
MHYVQSTLVQEVGRIQVHTVVSFFQDLTDMESGEMKLWSLTENWKI